MESEWKGASFSFHTESLDPTFSYQKLNVQLKLSEHKHLQNTLLLHILLCLSFMVIKIYTCHYCSSTFMSTACWWAGARKTRLCAVKA